MTAPTEREEFRHRYVLADGDTLEVTGVRYVTDPKPEPAPDPVLTAKAVRIRGAVYPLAGVNPTGTQFPGGRNTDELVLYRAPITRTVTNSYGREAAVVDGVVLGNLTLNQTLVPAGGWVLSGHGAAATWLTMNARPGAPVELLDKVPADIPTPTPTPTPTPAPDRGATIAIFRKDGPGTTTNIPAGVTAFLYSFFQNNRLVEWGGETVATQAANLGRWIDTAPAGSHRELMVAIGGAKGAAPTGNRGAFLGGWQTAEKDLGNRVTGMVWDLESGGMVVDDVLAISKAAAAGREKTFTIGFSPPGGDPVAPALQVAVALHRAGYRVWLGQQLYEGNVFITEKAALDALQRAVDAGLPPECVLLGTMVGSDWKHWTIPICVQVAKAARAKWPEFGGCYLWSEGQQAQDQAWATAMAAVFA